MRNADVSTGWDLLAWAGFAGLSLAALWHVAAIAGVEAASMEGPWAMVLFAGIFVVFAPTMYRLRGLQGRFNTPNGFWMLLEGLDPWMKWSFVALFAYAFVNFFVAGMFGARGPADPLVSARLFSGHAMVFYAASGVLNLAANRRAALGTWRCSNGHDVGPTAKFCEECGVPVNATATRPR